MRKICVFTGSRAEYGLLSWLMREIQSDSYLELKLIVSGSHTSKEFGSTWEQIEKDGFDTCNKINVELDDDSPLGVASVVGRSVLKISKVLKEINPDILVVLGDRYETFAAATSAMFLRIPIAHLHGGEATEGLVDEAIRHSITKMSHLHFTSTEMYRNRVMQLGESPERVFNFGAIGVDNITRCKLLGRDELQKSIGFSFEKKNLLVTYHPVTLDDMTEATQFKQLLGALEKQSNTNIIFTMPNADANGRVITNLINEYVLKNNKRAIAFKSLGQLRYFSTIQYVDAVIGNSSSGLIEVPSFNVGTINIGDRQRGRISGESIICCEPYCDDICEALNKVYSNEFKVKLKSSINPYKKDGTVKNIVKKLRDYPLDGILKKQFNNFINSS